MQQTEKSYYVPAIRSLTLTIFRHFFFFWLGMWDMKISWKFDWQYDDNINHSLGFYILKIINSIRVLLFLILTCQ